MMTQIDPALNINLAQLDSSTSAVPLSVINDWGRICPWHRPVRPCQLLDGDTITWRRRLSAHLGYPVPVNRRSRGREPRRRRFPHECLEQRGPSWQLDTSSGRSVPHRVVVIPRPSPLGDHPLIRVAFKPVYLCKKLLAESPPVGTNWTTRFEDFAAAFFALCMQHGPRNLPSRYELERAE